MDDPAITLFQGGGNTGLNLNLSQAGKAEEDEALQDMQRRREELHDLLANAFDDLIEDDDHSFNSSRLSAQNSRTYDGNVSQNVSRDNSNHSKQTSSNSVEVGKGEPSPTPLREPSATRLLTSPGKRGKRKKNAKSEDGGGDISLTTHQENLVHNTNAVPVHNSDDSFGRRDSYQGRGVMRNDNGFLRNNEQHMYLQTDVESQGQMEVLFRAQSQELERLKRELERAKDEAAREIRVLRHQKTLMESDREGALLSLKQAQSLLSDHKEEIETLKIQVATAGEKNKYLEEIKLELTEKLEVAEASFHTLKQQIQLMERGDVWRARHDQQDTRLKALTEQHQQEMLILKEKLDKTARQLRDKEEMTGSLERQLVELNRRYEKLLIEKTDTINHLAASLDQAQKQSQELIGSKMQIQLSSALAEKASLEERNKALQKELIMVTADLQQCEGVLTVFGEADMESDSIIMLGTKSPGGSRKRSSINPPSDLQARLRDELQRSLASQRLKRTEIKQLRKALEEKERVIGEMRAMEENYRKEMEVVKVEVSRLLQDRKRESDAANCSRRLQKEKENLETQLKERTNEVAELSNQCETLKSRLAELERASKDTVTHSQEIENVRTEIAEKYDKQISDLKSKLEETSKELEDVKSAYINVCEEKKEAHNHISTLLKQCNDFVKQEEQNENVILQTTSLYEMMKNELAKIRNECAENEDALETTKVELKQRIAELVQCKNDLETVKYELARVQEQLQKTKMALQRKQSDEDESDSIKVQLQERELEQKLASMEAQLKEKLEKAEQERERLRQEYQSEFETKLQQGIDVARKQFEAEIKIQSDREMRKLEAVWKKRLEVEVATAVAEARVELLQANRATCAEQALVKTASELKEVRAECESLRTQLSSMTLELRSQVGDSAQALIRLQRERMEDRLQNEYREQMCRLKQDRQQLIQDLKKQHEAEKSALIAHYEKELEAIERVSRTSSPAPRVLITEGTSPIKASFTRSEKEDDSVELNGPAKKLLNEKDKEINSLKELTTRLKEEYEGKSHRLSERLSNVESMYLSNLAKFKELIECKTKEVEEVKNVMIREREKLQSMKMTNADKEDLQHEIEKLQKECDNLREENKMQEQATMEERQKIVLLAEKWSLDFESLKRSRDSEEAKFCETEQKYNSLKMKVKRFKSRSLEKEMVHANEIQRLENLFYDALRTLKKKLDEVLSARNEKLSERFKEVLNHYEEMMSKLNNRHYCTRNKACQTDL